MFEYIHHQLMEQFVVRHQINTNIDRTLVSSVAKTIQASLSMYARRYRIIAANNDIYEVFRSKLHIIILLKLPHIHATVGTGKLPKSLACMLLLFVSSVELIHKVMPHHSLASKLTEALTQIQSSLPMCMRLIMSNLGTS